MKLNLYHSGLIELLKQSKPITIIKIHSQTDPHTIDDLVSELVSEVGSVEEYIYTPPQRGNDIVIRNGTPLAKREEFVPAIQNPNKQYVIVEDYIKTGWSLRHALRMLANQNVKPENIWCLSYINGVKYLDHAQNFLKAEDKTA